MFVMCCCLSSPVGASSVDDQRSISVGGTLANCCTNVKDGLVHTGNKLIEGAVHVYDFINNNKAKIFKFLIAWAVIISFVGMLYGFSATAEPLAIGLGCGAAFGALLGITTSLITHKTSYNHGLEKNKDKNTLYAMMVYSLWEQDDGTKALLTTVAVTVVFAAIAVFPLEVGVFMGVLVGNHVIVQLIYYDKNKPVAPNHEVRLADVDRRVDVLTRVMEETNPAALARARNDLETNPDARRSDLQTNSGAAAGSPAQTLRADASGENKNSFN